MPIEIDVDVLVAEYLGGESLVPLARKYKRRHQVISEILRGAGVNVTRSLNKDQWAERFISRIFHDPSGCWLWTGWVDFAGYGRNSIRRDGVTNSEGAHRLSYEMWIGPIPSGYEIDHVCHTADVLCPGGFTCPHRRCVNPDHLEAVTTFENLRRRRSKIKVDCVHGHPMSGDNLLIVNRKGGRPAERVCLTCKRNRDRRSEVSNP